MSLPSMLLAFRTKIHQKFRKRAEAALDLIDAVTTAGVVTSPVALSEEPPFRRKFSAVYDVLDHADVDLPELGKVLYEAQPADCETLAGYEVYAVDATPNPRPQAETLSDRVLLKADKDTPAVPGWKFSWLARLVQRGTSWVAPQSVEQIPAASSAHQVAGDQVAALDKQSRQPKVVVLDRGYFNHLFLALCVSLRSVILLVRMRHNSVLYEQPQPKPAKNKGVPRKHGAKFKFMKQRLGLNANFGTKPVSIQLWMRLCALAYWQLLLMRHDVADLRPAWHPRTVRSATQPLTPGQVQRGALRFLCKLGTPAAAPRPAGKGRGRRKGYHPSRRPRYPVLRKTPKAAPTAQKAPPMAPKPASQPL